MATIMSPPSPSSADSTNISPMVTDTSLRLPQRSSYSKERMSIYSNTSYTSQNRSRPGSHAFPIFHSSLSYALVRDFAYPSVHPLHYGPPPTPIVSTPVSEQRRLSDPPASFDSSRVQWSTGSWGTDNSYSGHQQLPAMSFGDGPPYSEDEDLHSPVVTTRHRRHKSTGTDLNGRRGRNQGRADPTFGAYSQEDDRGILVSMNADGSETYYVDDGDRAEDGPGGEFVTYPADEGRYSRMVHDDGRGYDPDTGFDSDDDDYDANRYSRDYYFAVGCPDEEMHGKAVALFDFTREHENELPLTEGQVIYVSYRQSQGWLVAEDPKTGESGLVPEEFVRLLRDIEGGLSSLNCEGSSLDTESETEADNTCLSPESTGSDQAIMPTEKHALLNSESNPDLSSRLPSTIHPSNGEMNGDHVVEVSLPNDLQIENPVYANSKSKSRQN